MKLNKLLLLGFLALYNVGFAQEKSLAYYEENFPKEHAIKLLDETNIVINVDKKKGLVITRNYIDEKMLISGQANAFTKRQVVFNSFFTIDEVEAASYVPLGNSYSKLKVRDFKTEKIMSDNVFHDDLQAIKFSYSDLKKGSKIDLRYTEEILNPFFVGPVYLQDSYFAEKIRVTLQVPEEVKIKIINYHLEKSKYNYSTSTKKGVVTHVWELDSVAKFESEGAAPDPAYYVPHIGFIIEGYTYNGEEKPVLRGVADLYQWYNGLLDSVDHTLSPALIKTVDSIANTTPNPLLRAKAIYDWVRNTIKYIAVEDGLGGFIPDDPSAVARKRFGDCKGMSCLMANMMRQAGLDAHECWIGTRDIPYTYTENYTPFADNHMITAFRHEEKWYFLDGTDAYIPFGYPSAFIQGKEALIGLGKDKFVLQKVPIMQAAASGVFTTDTLQLEGEMLSGKAKMTLMGYDAAFYKRRVRVTDDKKRFYKYYLQSGNDKFELDQLPTQSDKDSVVHINYKYKVPDYVRSFDNKYLVNLSMDRLLAESTLKDRKLPYERDYKHVYTFTHYLNVPKGFKVLAIPEDVEYSSDFADFSIKYSQENNHVKYFMQLELKELIMSASKVEAWNEMIKELRKAYRMNVELTKIN